MLGTVVTKSMKRTRQFQRFFQTPSLGEIEQTLGQAKNAWRVLGNLSRNLHCTFQQPFWQCQITNPNQFLGEGDESAMALSAYCI